MTDNVSSVPSVPVVEKQKRNRDNTKPNLRQVKTFIGQATRAAQKRPGLWAFDPLWKIYSQTNPGKDIEKFAATLREACAELSVPVPPETPDVAIKSGGTNYDFDMDIASVTEDENAQ